MEVKQIYELVNDITNEVLGSDDITLNEDLSNLVDVGDAVFDASKVDNYVKSLVDHVGEMIFVDRVYSASMPSILHKSWEYGSVVEKVRVTALPEATENDDWQLTDGQTYDPNVFHAPSVEVKFYNSKVTFDIEMSIVEDQVKSAFSNASQMNRFISMIYVAIENSMNLKIDSLIMRAVNNMVAGTVKSAYGSADFDSGSKVNAINLLYLYNNTMEPATPLTASNCLNDPEFIRFSVKQMGLIKSRLSKFSTLYNVGETPKFTPEKDLHCVFLSEMVESAKTYLQSDTYNKELVALPKHEEVPYWQGSGQDYSFANTSKVSVKCVMPDGTNENVTVSGVLGIMFDNEAVMVANTKRKTTSNYNGRADFTNYWFKYECSYFNDFNENFVVFFVA